MNARTYHRNTATQRNAALRKDRTEFIPAYACVAVDKSTHNFAHEIGMNEDEKSRGSAWLLLFVAGQQHSIQGLLRKGRIFYTWKCSTPFFPLSWQLRAIPEICERELRNRKKRWITHRMSTHRTATQRKSLRHIVRTYIAEYSHIIIYIAPHIYRTAHI